VFNATFKNISALSWRPVWLVLETGEPKETIQRPRKHSAHKTQDEDKNNSEVIYKSIEQQQCSLIYLTRLRILP
jgi:hypothetical protein